MVTVKVDYEYLKGVSDISLWVMQPGAITPMATSQNSFGQETIQFPTMGGVYNVLVYLCCGNHGNPSYSLSYEIRDYDGCVDDALETGDSAQYFSLSSGQYNDLMMCAWNLYSESEPELDSDWYGLQVPADPSTPFMQITLEQETLDAPDIVFWVDTPTGRTYSHYESESVRAVVVDTRAPGTYAMRVYPYNLEGSVTDSHYKLNIQYLNALQTQTHMTEEDAEPTTQPPNKNTEPKINTGIDVIEQAPIAPSADKSHNVLRNAGVIAGICIAAIVAMAVISVIILVVVKKVHNPEANSYFEFDKIKSAVICCGHRTEATV